MDRVREWLGIPEHSEEHREIKRELHEQKVALARLDVIVSAKTRRSAERRRMLTPIHPHRRSDDL